MVDITFLEAAKPLRKKITRTAEGEIEKTPWPRVARFASRFEHVENITELYERLQYADEQGWCLLRGGLTQSLDWESRAGKANKKRPTSLLILDCDGVQGAPTPEYLVSALGLPADAPYIIHHTASAGLPGDEDALRCHLFFPLERPVSFAALRRYQKELNLRTPLISGQMRLSADGRTFLWPIDLATAVPSQLVFLSTPTFTGMGDPLEGKRWELMNPDAEPLPLTALATRLSEEELSTTQGNLLAQLQGERGLRRGTAPSTKMVSRLGCDWEQVINPGVATVSSTRSDRDYVRLNVDGGDSWAYWHPSSSARYVYSFKGMYMYETRRFLPDYWQHWQEEMVESTRDERTTERQEDQDAFVGSATPRILTFIDAATEMFWCGEVTPETPPGEMRKFSKFATVKSWVTDKGGMVDRPADLPVWDVDFVPGAPAYDFTERRVNVFPTREEAVSAGPPPDMLTNFITHVLGGKEEMYETFMHWLAMIYQSAKATHTAWLLWGTPGTGKDLLTGFCRAVLHPSVCRIVSPHQIQEGFNAWAMHNLLAVVNEVDTGNLDPKKGMPRVKDMITADNLSIRVMRKDAFEVQNHLNFIFCSNRPGALYIEPGDRRFHVPPRQEVPLRQVMDPDKLVPMLQNPAVVQSMRAWLRDMEVDEKRVRIPSNTSAKSSLMTATQTAAERLAEAFKRGDIVSLAEMMPAPSALEFVSNRVLSGTPDPEAALEEIFSASAGGGADAGRPGRVDALGTTNERAVFDICIIGR